MPLGDLAGEAIGGVFRVVGRILVEVFFEILIKGSGYVLIRMVRPKPEPGETECAVAGLLVFIVGGVGIYFLSRAIAAP